MIEWTVVTVTYNSERFLDERWAGLVSERVEWLVVDNASQDNTVSRAAELGATVIPMGRNAGFAVANNVGTSAARGEFVLFLNPDIHPEVRDLASLREAVESVGGLVSPQLLNPDGSRQPNGRGLPFLVDKFGHRNVKLPGARPSEYLPHDGGLALEPVAWVIGAAVAARRQEIDKIGGWDERFFLYYEDHELGLRAWRRGLSVHIVSGIRWVHDWQRETSGFRLKPWLREFASAAKFFRLYPGLLWATAKRRAALSAKYGTPRKEIAQ